MVENKRKFSYYDNKFQIYGLCEMLPLPD